MARDEFENNPKAREAFESMLPLDGGKLRIAQAEALERLLLKEPNNLSARLKLLGFYFLRSSKFRAHAQKRLKHVLWLIDNRPFHQVTSEPWIHLFDTSSPKEFAEAREHWFQQIEKNPKSPTVYGSAAAFVWWRDIDLTLQLLQRAEELDPNNHRWPQRAIHYSYLEFRFGMRHYKSRYGRIVLDKGRRSVRIDPGEDFVLRIACCEQVAECALYLGALDLAEEFAELLSKSQQSDGSCSQYVYAVRGLVALRRGNVELAKSQLLNVYSGHYPRSVTMQLTQELLNLGEVNTVLQFLDTYEQLKIMDRRTARSLMNEIRKGEMRDLETRYF